MELHDWDLTEAATPSPHVKVARRGRLGLILLDRPRAINALTHDMVTAVLAQLRAWADDAAVASVAVAGTGERGLCAGGDVVAVRAGVLAGGDEAERALGFFETEYAMNRTIAHYPKPVVALLEGVVMGGGVGVSGHAAVRLVDPGVRLAMPETIIGFFPDVGARALLAACPGGTGAHLAMSGATITGADAVRLGFGDALVPAARFEELLRTYAELDTPTADRLLELARDLVGELPAEQTTAPLADDHAWADECYVGDDPAHCLRLLRDHPHPAAAEAVTAIEARSPFAVQVALRSLRMVQDWGWDVDTVLDHDLLLADAMAHTADFLEGVRAQLVDKDRTPRWQHASLDQVVLADVEKALHGDEDAEPYGD